MATKILASAVVALTLAAAGSVGSAHADWTDDATMAAGLATIAAGTAVALADTSYGYGRPAYRPGRHRTRARMPGGQFDMRRLQQGF